MSLSWIDAQKAVLDPGSGTPFELTETEVFGVKMEVFKNAPQNLAVALQGARAHGDATFLLYEGERYTFARVMDEVDGLAHLLVNTYGAFRGTLSVVGMGKKGDEPYMTHRRKEIMFEGPAEVVRFRPRLSMSGDRLRSLPSDFFSSPVTSRVNTVHDMVT